MGTVLMLVWFGGWQAQLRQMMGVAGEPWYAYPLIVFLTVVLFGGIVGVCRLWLRASRWTGRRLNRIAPPRVSAVLGGVLVTALVVGVLNGVVLSRARSGLDATFRALNAATAPGVNPPSRAERSGGPGSLIAWDSLGRQGQTFVAGGPTGQQLAAFSGHTAVQPVRAYTGLAAADTVEAEADLTVRELERTGGFTRAVLGVATTTGSGWVNEKSASALEYLYNGNTAIVSMQYSYLPSWLSYMLDTARAKQAGKALFNAVYTKWATLPVTTRPKLVAFGESLGSFGGEAAFSGVADIRARTDGVLFVGPPSSNELWRQVVSQRDPGTPEWLPIYQAGTTVRFAARPSDLSVPPGTWTAPRVVYLQQPSDPIVWWSPSLLFTKPEWLQEPRGYDVLPSTRWIPVVTFLQTAADMAVANDVPEGHGHLYGGTVADAWAAVLPPAGWTPADTDRLHRLMNLTDGD